MSLASAIFFAKIPLIRGVIPLAAGILLQWYAQPPTVLGIVLLALSVLMWLLFLFSSLTQKFKYGWLQGLGINAGLVAAGMLLVVAKDVRNKEDWFGKQQTNGHTIVACLQEVPISKTKSYKANAKVLGIIKNRNFTKATGNIILYFEKDTAIGLLQPGSSIAFTKPLQEIKNNGNPGGFDYKRYALFNGITHQVYLTKNNFRLLPEKHISLLQQLLYKTRTYVLNTLTTYIQGKKEQGLAEALLIGYKEDLDKTLLQSYTNTGVVHIIAVSGMHLALLFFILNFIFTPLLLHRSTRWLQPVLVILILWLFTLLAGGAASIVRAAVMFTFIMAGKLLRRTASVYNTLAASAFCLLCYNPYWLWDVGFQLSYAAVLSIVMFYKPIYHLLFIKNKLLDKFWQLVAVSIAAQIITTPVSIYHFHQFPVYFLLTNIFAVPVSSIVLIGTLVLLGASPIPFMATMVGNIVYRLIEWLNAFIERVEQLPLALWDGLQISMLQLILLLAVIAALSWFWFEKHKAGLWAGLYFLLVFFALRTWSFYEANHQQKIIIYNVPKKLAIDFIDGRQYYFYGDSALLKDDFLRNFHIKPSRVQQRLSPADSLQSLSQNGTAFVFKNKKMIVIRTSITQDSVLKPITADLVILSGNPRLYIAQLKNKIVAKQIVIDSSVPAWKAGYWQRDCDSLHIPCHNVSSQGAFVLNL